MLIENPAQQLLSILEKGKQTPKNILTRDALSKLLLVQNNEPLLLNRVASFFTLADSTVLSLKNINSFDQHTTSHWYGQMNKAMLKLNMNVAWDNTINLIDQHSINYIRSHAYLLNAHSSVKSIPAEKLSDTKESLQELVKKIQESDFEQEMKNYLVRSISIVINHIDEYFLTGYVPIVESLNAIYGKAVMEPDFKETIKKSDLNVWEILSNASSVISVSTGLPQIAAGVSILLESLTK
jgi:hypothetical protein